MKSVFLIISALFLISTVSAITASEIPEDPSDQQIENLVDLYNNNTDQVSGYVRSVVGSQDINLNYENTTYGIELNNLKIEDVNQSFNDSTLDVWVEQEDVVEVANASSPRQELREKISDGDIRYMEKGVLNKIKFSVLRLFL